MINFIKKFKPIAGVAQIGQNSFVEWTRLFGYCPRQRNLLLAAAKKWTRRVLIIGVSKSFTTRA